MYINQPIKKYLNDLAARTPAPGGGSAAAMASAMAASLVIMGCRFTLGKEKYRNSFGRAKQILARSLSMQKKLSALMDQDVAAYRRKDLRNAIRVPAEVCVLSCDLMAMADELLECGNKNLSTDTGLAVLLAEAGFLSAFSYVALNIRSQKTKTKKYGQLLFRLKKLASKVRVLRKKAEVKVGYSLGR